MAACYRGHVSVVRLLVEAGSQVNLRDVVRSFTGHLSNPFNSSSSQTIRQRRHVTESNDAGLVAPCTPLSLSPPLSQHGRNSLYMSAEEGRLDCLRYLLTRGADVDARDTDGRTSLHRACERGRAECAEAILDSGCDIHARTAARARLHRRTSP